jgi:hypothetical protein
MNYPVYNLKKLKKAELIAILERIDKVTPLADTSCDKPGITLSEAVFRELIDEKVIQK